MKTRIAITILFLCLVYQSQSQSDSITPNKIYTTWINSKKAGALFEIKDSSVMVSNSLKAMDYYQGKYDVTRFDIRNISEIKTRKKGGVGMGALYGVIAGLVVGGALDLIYYSSWKDYDPPEAHGDWGQGLANAVVKSPGYFAIGASMIGVSCIGIGAAIGAAIGSAKITIPINGSREVYDQNRSALEKLSIKSNLFSENKTFSKLNDTLVDIDGNAYHTLALGGQVWMAENLKVTHYRDGSEIKNVTKNDQEDGWQYSWVAIGDSSKLCPAGWHVPSLAEWTSLYNSLGGENGAGSKLAESFSAGEQVDNWWSSTEQDTGSFYNLFLTNGICGIMFSGATSGLSVRCIRDQ
jgi:hypothetical protein